MKWSSNNPLTLVFFSKLGSHALGWLLSLYLLFLQSKTAASYLPGSLAHNKSPVFAWVLFAKSVYLTLQTAPWTMTMLIVQEFGWSYICSQAQTVPRISLLTKTQCHVPRGWCSLGDSWICLPGIVRKSRLLDRYISLKTIFFTRHLYSSLGN